MRLVDSHCHLDHAKFEGDREAAIERAREAGVERLVVIGTGDGPPDLEAGLRLAERYDEIYFTAGVHPHDASKMDGAALEKLRSLTGHPKLVAIGETGLDFHYDFSPRPQQAEVFEAQLAIAREAGLPVVIHTREAWKETMEILRRHRVERGILHCFTGGPDEAREALDLGLHLGFGGVLTFPKSDELRAAAKMTPDDRLLVETDAPYLAPIPHRGKRNEPAFVVETARKLAEVRDTTPERIAELTTANWERLCLAGSGLPGSNTNRYTRDSA